MVTYLRKSGKVKQKPIPPVLAEASCLHRQNFEKLKLATADPESTHEVGEAAKLDHKTSRAALQSAKLVVTVSKEAEVYEHLDIILSHNPRSLFKTIKSMKKSSVTLNKASIQAKCLSGRFRTENLLAIFSNSNSEFVSCIPRQKLLVTSTII